MNKKEKKNYLIFLIFGPNMCARPSQQLHTNEEKPERKKKKKKAKKPKLKNNIENVKETRARKINSTCHVQIQTSNATRERKKKKHNKNQSRTT